MLSRLRSFGRDRSGIAMVEFALALPLFVGIALMGTETVNFAYANQKLGDVATLAADNISRIRISISEDDISEALTGIKATADNIGFSQHGRLIVSSIQPVLDSNGNVTNQKIRWQRCTGALRATSSYGAQSATLGTAGIGPAGRKISTGAGRELIFVEVVYEYQPLISQSLLGARTIRTISAMNVRERSSNDVVQNGTTSSCSAYSA